MGEPVLYDVVHLGRDVRRSLVAARLHREEAIALARREARSRGLGRMFLAGSERAREVVALVPARPNADAGSGRIGRGRWGAATGTRGALR